MVEGSEKRRLEMERNEEGKGLVCEIEKPEGDNSDLQLQLRERESKKNKNPNARPMGTLQSQI